VNNCEKSSQNAKRNRKEKIEKKKKEGPKQGLPLIL
jgi:hypothetical protein